MIKSDKDFNLIIAGVGGQGLLTVMAVLLEAALLEKKDVKTSELHGLSQRGGSVKVHFRMGREIFSPMVMQGQVDLVLALELQEALGASYFGSRENGTVFVADHYFVSIEGKRLPEKISPEKKKTIINDLEKFGKKAFLVPAMEICQKELQNPVTAGIFLMAFAVCRKLIPLKPESVMQALKNVIPPQFLDLNLKTWELAENYAETILNNLL